MSTEKIFIKVFQLPDFSDSEILRYAGARGCKEKYSELLSVAKSELNSCVQNTVLYRFCNIAVSGTECDFGFAKICSSALAKCLEGAERVIFMCTTAGIGIDRLILKYERLSSAVAHIISSAGSERVEALCDTFCDTVAAELSVGGYELTPRFSPGYGDLPLEFQKEMFAYLSPEKHIGLTLNDSLLMSPSKSVSAIIGIRKKK